MAFEFIPISSQSYRVYYCRYIRDINLCRNMDDRSFIQRLATYVYSIHILILLSTVTGISGFVGSIYWEISGDAFVDPIQWIYRICVIAMMEILQ